MKKIITTVIRGYAGVLLPLSILIILLEKLAHVIRPAVHAIEDKLHLHNFIGVAAVAVISIILMLLLGWFCGWLVKVPFVRRWIDKLENTFLRRIPLYNMLKSMASEQAGDTDKSNWRPALVHDDVSYYLATVVDESESYYTVLCGPMNIHADADKKVVSKHRVVLIDMPLLEFNKYEKLHGKNCAELVEKYIPKLPANQDEE